MFRMVNKNIFNALSKFESQIWRKNGVTVIRILCFVNKARVLLLFTYVLYLKSVNIMLLFVVDRIIYENIESVYFVYHKLFCLRNGNFFTLPYL